ncbi:hypothetical protein GCM10007890_19640 [Methylobacterium tardum]|uniref:Uncharacterized protein n=1 Tax=Methylobacterium tardum TaxID=374432 RepID=A0AA37TAR2_9HYPH|nr:hypothetical protein GCM10007890_19640 [Methylobacterium tardum]
MLPPLPVVLACESCPSLRAATLFYPSEKRSLPVGPGWQVTTPGALGETMIVVLVWLSITACAKAGVGRAVTMAVASSVMPICCRVNCGRTLLKRGTISLAHNRCRANPGVPAMGARTRYATLIVFAVLVVLPANPKL